jgi:hypothetical protein
MGKDKPPNLDYSVLYEVKINWLSVIRLHPKSVIAISTLKMPPARLNECNPDVSPIDFSTNGAIRFPRSGFVGRQRPRRS